MGNYFLDLDKNKKKSGSTSNGNIFMDDSIRTFRVGNAETSDSTEVGNSEIFDALQIKKKENAKKFAPTQTMSSVPKSAIEEANNNDDGNKPSWLKTIGGSLVKGLANTASGLLSAKNTFNSLVDKYTPEPIKKINKAMDPLHTNELREGALNAANIALDKKSMDIDEWTAYNKQSLPQKVVGDALTSVPQIGLAIANPALFGVSAGGNYASEARAKGASTEKQALYGIVGGAAEMQLNKALDLIPGYQKLFREGFANGAVNKLTTNTLKNIGNMGKEAIKLQGKEAIEEMAIDPIMSVADQTILQGKYNPMDWKLTGEGGVLDVNQMAYDGLVGFVSSGAISTPAYAKHAANAIQAKKYIEDNYPDALAYAATLPEDSNSHQMAEALKGLNRDVTVNDVHTLLQEVEKDYTAMAQQETPVEQPVPPVQEEPIEQPPAIKELSIDDIAKQYEGVQEADPTDEVTRWKQELQKKFGVTPKEAEPVQQKENKVSLNDIVKQYEGQIDEADMSEWNNFIQSKAEQPQVEEKTIEPSVSTSTETNSNKVKLKGYGEVEVLDNDGSLVTVKNKQGTELKIGKKAFENLKENGPVKEAAKVETKPEVKENTKDHAEGDKVEYTDKHGRNITGTVDSIDEEEGTATIKVDTTGRIKRKEVVSLDEISSTDTNTKEEPISIDDVLDESEDDEDVPKGKRTKEALPPHKYKIGDKVLINGEEYTISNPFWQGSGDTAQKFYNPYKMEGKKKKIKYLVKEEDITPIDDIEETKSAESTETNKESSDKPKNLAQLKKYLKPGMVLTLNGDGFNNAYREINYINGTLVNFYANEDRTKAANLRFEGAKNFTFLEDGFTHGNLTYTYTDKVAENNKPIVETKQDKTHENYFEENEVVPYYDKLVRDKLSDDVYISDILDEHSGEYYKEHLYGEKYPAETYIMKAYQALSQELEAKEAGKSVEELEKEKQEISDKQTEEAQKSMNERSDRDILDRITRTLDTIEKLQSAIDNGTGTKKLTKDLEILTTNLENFTKDNKITFGSMTGIISDEVMTSAKYAIEKARELLEVDPVEEKLNKLIGMMEGKENGLDTEGKGNATEDKSEAEEKEPGEVSKPGKKSSSKSGSSRGKSNGKSNEESTEGNGNDESNSKSSSNNDDSKGNGGRNLKERATKPGRNYRITEDDVLFEGGKKTRFKNNIAAIKLVKQLEAEGREATAEEQKILIKYVGWGGISEAFDKTYDRQKGYVPAKAEWSKEFYELQELLTEEEYRTAASSTQSAFYTHPDIIKAMYSMAEQLGFAGGNILEPASGVGNFMGLIPEKFARSKFVAVEKDKITGLIAKHLYPDSDVRISGFEEVSIPNDYFDLAISNVPFGDIRISDKSYKQSYITQRIHNYFFVKAMDKVKPGGAVMFITSSGTMNAQDDTARSIRQHLSTMADLVTAVRLPGNAFKENAGTEVTTDIIILRKKIPGEMSKGEAWQNIEPIELKGKYGNTLYANEYFNEHPDYVLGKYVEDKLYTGRIGVEAEGNTIARLNSLIDTLPRNVFNPIKGKIQEMTSEEEAAKLKEVKNNSYYTKDGKVYQKLGDTAQEITGNNAPKIKALVDIKEALKEVIAGQLNEVSDSDLKKMQTKLNKAYDSFTKKYGVIQDKKNKNVLKVDPENYLLLSLETYDKKSDKFVKSSIFSERSLKPTKKAERADTPVEALSIALNEKGYLDMGRVADLLNVSDEEAAKQLKGYVFKNPSGSYETADEYLSGNVKEKLVKAREAAKLDPQYKENVEALEEVQPEPKKYTDIDVKLGASWIPSGIYKKFIGELLNLGGGWRMNELKVSYNEVSGTWSIEGKRSNLNTFENTTKYATASRSATDLIEDALNMKRTVINRKDADGNTYVDQEETAEASEKQNQIKEAFIEWIWKEEGRIEQLETLYNDVYNNIRTRSYQGIERTYPGMNSNIQLRQHQREGVERVIFGGNTLLAHGVGFGKTFIMITSAMELKRLGIANKPIMVVPNEKLTDFQNDFKLLYPNAKILAAAEDDFNPQNIKQLFAKIATNDWDTIIIKHSSFTKIPVSKETQRAYYQEQVDAVEKAIVEAAVDSDNKRTQKQLEKAKDNLMAKLQDVDNLPKYDVLTLEEMGIDYMFVDEAHEYKNLRMYTKLSNVKGISTRDVPTTNDFYMKARYISQLQGGKRGLVFATGTPISNTLNELYTMFKYLRPDILRERGIEHFDAWLSVFGNIQSKIEVKPDGRFKPVDRFRSFVNVKELMKLFKEFADIKMDSDAVKLNIPELEGGKAMLEESSAHPDFPEFIKDIVRRIDNLPKRPEKGQDNALSVGTDARKATTDMRLINPEAEDYPDSKINRTVKNVYANYLQEKDKKGAQLIFLKEGVSYDKETGKPIFDANEDIKTKLINLGVKPSEIAFPNKYKTKEQKEQLYKKVNSGEIRVLIGTYAAMGTGLNVQERLYAIHEIDVPYRPSDIEQAEGRMLRQGNTYYDLKKPVRIYRYIVSSEGSYDAFMWQLIESKLVGQKKFYAGDIDNVDADSDADIINVQQIKARATNNPKAIRQAEIVPQIAVLRALKNGYQNEIMESRKKLRQLPGNIDTAKKAIENIKKDIAGVKDVSGNNFSITIDGKKYTDKEKAGKAFKELATKNNTKRLGLDEKSKFTIGSYAGFDIVMNVTTFGAPNYSLENNASYGFDPLGGLNSDTGIFTRLDTLIKSLPGKLTDVQRKLEGYEQELVQRQEAIKKPFAREKELQDLLAENVKLTAELKDINKPSDTDTGIELVGDKESEDSYSGEDKFVSSAAGPTLGKATGLNKTGKAKRASEIFKEFGEKLDTTIKKKRGGAALGTFNNQSYIIRIKKANDIAVLSHEVGHMLDRMFDISSKPSMLVKRELEALGKATSRKSYSKERVRREGIAEFVRLYLTDSEKIDSVAPNTVAYFERKVPKDILEVLRGFKGDIWDLTNLDPVERVMKSIHFRGDLDRKQPLDMKKKADEVGRKLYTGLYDYLYPVQWAAEQLGDSVDKVKNKLSVLRGYEDIATYDIAREQIDLNGEPIGKSYSDIMKPIHESEEKRRKFFAYSLGRRSLDYFDRNLELPDTKETYEAVVKTLEAQYPEFKKVFEETVEYRKNNTKLLVDAGIYSSDKFNEMLMANENYVPLKRIMEHIDGIAGSGKNLAGAKKVVKNIKGGGQDILDPEESDVNNTFMYRSVAMRNKILTELAELADSAENAGHIMSRSEKKLSAIAFTAEQLEKQLKDIGVETDGVDLNVMMRVFNPNYLAGPNQIVIYREGSPQLYDVHPELYKAIADMKYESANAVMEAMMSIASFTKGGIILTPKYIAYNAARDTIHNLISTRSGINPLDIVGGFISAVRKDKYYKLALRKGGGTNYFSVNERKHAQDAMEDMLTGGNYAKKFTSRMKESGMLLSNGRIGKGLLRVIDSLGVVGEMMHDGITPFEMAGRVAELKKHLKKFGYSEAEIEKGIADMRNLSVDFKMQGRWIKQSQWNRLANFMNAGLQGAKNTAMLFNTPKKAFETSWKGALYITLPTLILMALNDDNEYYDELPSWRKDFFFNIPLDIWKAAYGQKPTSNIFIPVPKPYELGLIFGALPERMIKAGAKNDIHAYEGLMESIHQALVPEVIPSALQPLLQDYAGVTWNGRPILNTTDKQLVGEDVYMQYNEYTSETSKAIGRLLKGTPAPEALRSPKRLDALIKGYTGTAGSVALESIDQFAGKKDGIPVVGGLTRNFITDAQNSPESVNRFYEYKEKLESDYRVAKRNEKDFVGTPKILRSDFAKIAEDMNDLNKQKDWYENPKNTKNMTPSEIKLQITAINSRIINLARNANKSFENGYKK